MDESEEVLLDVFFGVSNDDGGLSSFPETSVVSSISTTYTPNTPAKISSRTMSTCEAKYDPVTPALSVHSTLGIRAILWCHPPVISIQLVLNGLTDDRGRSSWPGWPS